ncbi:MAG: hypothetical protein WA769_15720, partial [Pseudolabrys sp.]
TAEHFQKLAGPFCELLVGQFTSGMFGLESFVNGGQWVNRVAKIHAAHQRVNSGGCESPVRSAAMSLVFICCRASLRCYLCLK